MTRRILMLSSAQYSDRSWVNCQQIASRLARRHQVLFIDSIGLRSLRPAGADLRRVTRRALDALRGTRKSQENVWVASPIARGGLGLRLSVELAVRRAGFRPDVVIAYLPTWAPIVECFPDAFRIYHCVDNYAENPGVDRARIDRLERRLLRGVDEVWAVSAPILGRLAPLHRRVRLVPNVADTSAFEAGASTPMPPDLESIPPPRILYLGNLASYKTDLDLIARLARRRGDRSWVLVGPIGRGDPSTEISALAWPPNVHILGERSREEAPAYAAAADLCVLPLRRNRSTESSHPLKIYEYLASGRPVVGTPIPALGELIAAGLVRGATDEQSWLEAIEAALQESGQGAEARRAEARKHGWTTRISEIELWLDEARQERFSGRRGGGARPNRGSEPPRQRPGDEAARADAGPPEPPPPNHRAG